MAPKRACDACHRRKVKCIGAGSKQCRNCAASALACTFNAVPQKKGPKGSRAKVISELRETQRAQRTAIASSPASPGSFITPGLLSYETIERCVAFYFDNLYPTQPILERDQVMQAVARMYEDAEAYAFIASLCAYMCIQPGNLALSEDSLPSYETRDQTNVAFGQALLQEASRVRKGFDWIEAPTVWSVTTSFFFFGSYFCLGRHNLAWFYLREATTIAELIGMHEEASYRSTDLVGNSRKRRLYWLLFVTERAYALQQHKPLTLHATIDLPSLNDDPSETRELNGFIHLVNLFRPFDDTFVGLWNKANAAIPPGSWLKDLQEALSDALPVYLDCTESQAVDLRLSQAWLKTMVWQLSISHGALSSLAKDNAMSFSYPIEVSRNLVAAASQFSQHSMEIHGIGLIEKLFDVACTLTDVISCAPCGSDGFEFGPRDYLTQIISLIAQLRGGQQRYVPLLATKIQDTMPSSMSFTLPIIATDNMILSDGTTGTSPSNGSSPFGSPNFSVSDSQSTGFGFGIMASPTISEATHVAISSGIEFGDMTVSTPLMPFTEATLYQEPETFLKFEENG